MTKEEAIEIIKIIDKRYCTLDKDERQALAVAIKALEQEPCDDCVSRSAVMQIVEISRLHLDRKYDTEVMSEQIKALPPVFPKREQGEWENTKNMMLPPEMRK